MATHGTYSGYTRGCRCAECKQAQRDYVADYRERVEVVHGTSAGYTTGGCRCDDCKQAQRAYQMKAKYGLEWSDYLVMEAEQGGVCAACGNPPTARGFDVDHDHGGGAVRGLLCQHCNIALGHLMDDPNRIRSLLAYLLASQTR